MFVLGSVAIFGCGPAGLLAAHAARLSGHHVTIISKKQKSPMAGAQYMHVEIPGMRQPEPEIIKYMLIGNVNAYRDKVYGTHDPDIVVSPQEFVGEHKCWNIRHMYARLWVAWKDKVVDAEIKQSMLATVIEHHDFVFSTIPARALCQHADQDNSPHKFNFVPVWIDGTWSGPTPAEDKGMWGSTQNIVLCNGLRVDETRPELTGWYRTSHIYGHTNTEWASPRLVPPRYHVDRKLWRVRKPIDTNCDCWPDITRIGRYGKWQKGVLTHHAFYDVMDILS